MTTSSEVLIPVPPRSRSFSIYLLLSAATAVLLVAIAVNTFETDASKTRVIRRDIRTLLPAGTELKAWEASSVPISATEHSDRTIGDILRYDDAVYTMYRSADRRVCIYVAYWMPGKSPARLISGHTPDVCWPAAGWTVVNLPLQQEVIAFGNAALRVQTRAFEQHNHKEHVIFCHLVGGIPVSYGTMGRPPWYAPFFDVVNIGLRQRADQLFFRISSDRPFGEFQSDEPVQEFLRRLFGNLGA